MLAVFDICFLPSVDVPVEDPGEDPPSTAPGFETFEVTLIIVGRSALKDMMMLSVLAYEVDAKS
tara:strand:+ start:192 stop:383 length:192 start_codon:yes stop_codon:yes gene_type:complete